MFRKTGFLELEFEGDRRILPTCVISALEAKRLLLKGCEAYLAHMINKSSPKVTLDSVSIVREFLNVVFEDLLGLLQDQELKFEIELLSGSAFIFVPPYKMGLVELKELRTQLQDFEDKRFTD